MSHVFNLRMNIDCSPEEVVVQTDADFEKIEVMISQNNSEVYRCRDYLRRRAMSSTAKNEVSVSPDEAVDEVCREQMVDWCYKVADHFAISREICAFAISYLDRFIDRCSCDRTAFKLAAMTSLYIATKMFNSQQLSTTSLAVLSRGEFLGSHISQMEQIIMESLDYRMNPPTIQAFIQQLRSMIPTAMEDHQVEEVCKRATFYCELSVYDYSFVEESKYLLAVACIVTAMLDLEGPAIGKQYADMFCTDLKSSLGADLAVKNLETAQSRLWYLYSCSLQSQYDDIQSVESFHEHQHKDNDDYSYKFASSPVSVLPKSKFGYDCPIIFNPL